MSSEQQAHLLGDSHSDTSDEFANLPQQVTEKEQQYFRKPHSLGLGVSVLIHACLIVGYTLISGLVIWHMKEKYSSTHELVYSPARESVRVEKKDFTLVKATNNFTGPYSGMPTPEIDDRWEALVENLNFRITDDEMEKLGEVNNAVHLPDGGYLANLNIHHELHCLMRLRWNLYPEFYFPDATPDMLVRNREHSEHCIDMLRFGTMCHSDITLLPYQWIRNAREPVLNFGRPHECVNWDLVNQWAGDRFVDLSEPGYLNHPNLGPAYPNGPMKHTYQYNATLQTFRDDFA